VQEIEANEEAHQQLGEEVLHAEAKLLSAREGLSVAEREIEEAAGQALHAEADAASLRHTGDLDMAAAKSIQASQMHRRARDAQRAAEEASALVEKLHRTYEALKEKQAKAHTNITCLQAEHTRLHNLLEASKTTRQAALDVNNVGAEATDAWLRVKVASERASKSAAQARHLKAQAQVLSCSGNMEESTRVMHEAECLARTAAEYEDEVGEYTKEAKGLDKKKASSTGKLGIMLQHLDLLQRIKSNADLEYSCNERTKELEGQAKSLESQMEAIEEEAEQQDAECTAAKARAVELAEIATTFEAQGDEKRAQESRADASIWQKRATDAAKRVKDLKEVLLDKKMLFNDIDGQVESIKREKKGAEDVAMELATLSAAVEDVIKLTEQSQIQEEAFDTVRDEYLKIDAEAKRLERALSNVRPCSEAHGFLLESGDKGSLSKHDVAELKAHHVETVKALEIKKAVLDAKEACAADAKKASLRALQQVTLVQMALDKMSSLHRHEATVRKAEHIARTSFETRQESAQAAQRVADANQAKVHAAGLRKAAAELKKAGRTGEAKRAEEEALVASKDAAAKLAAVQEDEKHAQRKKVAADQAAAQAASVRIKLEDESKHLARLQKSAKAVMLVRNLESKIEGFREGTLEAKEDVRIAKTACAAASARVQEASFEVQEITTKAKELQGEIDSLESEVAEARKVAVLPFRQK
jgi:hypothetical protein